MDAEDAMVLPSSIVALTPLGSSRTKVGSRQPEGLSKTTVWLRRGLVEGTINRNDVIWQVFREREHCIAFWISDGTCSGVASIPMSMFRMVANRNHMPTFRITLSPEFLPTHYGELGITWRQRMGQTGGLFVPRNSINHDRSSGDHFVEG